MNLYSLPPLFAGLLTLTVGLVALLSNRRSKPNVAFFFVTLSVFCWLVGYAIVYSLQSYPTALAWVRWLYVGVVFIPVTSLHFAIVLTHREHFRRWLPLFYAGAGIFAGMTRSARFIEGLHEFHWGFQTRVGPLHNLFLMFFLGIMADVLYLLASYSRRMRSTAPLEATKVRYVFLSYCVSVMAATDFLANYGVELYPIGFSFITLHATTTTYALVRYRLLDANVAILRMALFLGVFVSLLACPFGLAYWAQPALSAHFGSLWWVVPLGLMGFCAASAPLVFFAIRRRAEAWLLRDQRRYQQTLLAASSGMTQVRDLARLCRLIVHMVTKTVGLRHAGIFLYEPKEEVFVLAARRYGRADVATARLSKNDPTVELLREVRQPVVLAELKAQLGDGEAKEAPARRMTRALAWMESQHASVLVPSFAQESLIGFLVLGEKRSTRIFTTEDLNVFATLANQAALAIENARFYQSEKERQAALFHSASLASLGTMASSMSHQVNNRFNVMSVIGGIRKEALQQLLARDLQGPAEWRKALEEDLAHFDSVREEALRGGQIVAAIRKIIKPSTEGYQPLAIAEAVHVALRVVQYKVPLEQVDLQVALPEELPKISGDLPQLGECFFNFVDNAWDAITERQERLKPPPDYKGTIRIQATAATTSDSHAKRNRSELVLTVSDNGIGVKPEDLPKLFVPFFTTKATAEKGTGLGLYVIKKIIEAHGGTITVDSTYGQSTTFTIHLPALPPGTHEPPLPRPPRAA